MKLKRQDSQTPDFKQLNTMICLMKELLKSNKTTLSLEELHSFQTEDGSFGLFNDYQIPREARIDYIYIPTYIGTAILMKEYLNGNKDVEKGLIKGLELTQKTNLTGHGYEGEKSRIDSLKIFIAGGLGEFLEMKKEISPKFHEMIHNILHEYNSRIINEETKGAWGEDYQKDWLDITRSLKTKTRLYLAYGSNMNRNQMKERCEGASFVGTTYLHGWELTIPFYANIEKNSNEKTPAVIWEISAKDEEILNGYEGYPRMYNKKEVIIEVNNIEMTSMVYIMTDEYKKSNKSAREGYIEGIIDGYVDAGFDVADLYESVNGEATSIG